MLRALIARADDEPQRGGHASNDLNSPERQRANIQAVCERNNWIPEWYEDTDGHKSGTTEKNRPSWLALKSRLGESDVVALVANDLARLHRKGWRVGDLIEYLDRRGVTLVLAAPGREIDLSTPMGRLFVQFTAILDEWYAADISQRAKDSIAYRKAQGKSIGMPPFGTKRGDDGYLKPSEEGAWLLPDGTFAAGSADQSPSDGAVWRGYHQAAEFILTLYATGHKGMERIAYQFNHEGWAFRDRTGEPRIIYRDDVRRVVANWAEYGGVVLEKGTKWRPAYEPLDIASVPFVPERAVFPLKLLQTVAKVRQERTMRRLDQGVTQKSHFYPLAGITYCASCERRAAEANDPRLRSPLGGTDTYGTRRYRHKTGIQCGCTNRSVLCETFEADFARLIKLLEIKPEAMDLMTELAIQADRANHNSIDAEDFESQKAEAIAQCRRRIDAAVVLFGDGMIDREEYRHRVSTNQREITHWETRTSDTQMLAMELSLCIQAVDTIARLWDISSDEDRQGLVRSLFEYVSYDLDTQRIVDFRLKPWADRFLVVRAALYAEDETGGSGGSEAGEGTLSVREAEAGYDETARMEHRITHA